MAPMVVSKCETCNGPLPPKVEWFHHTFCRLWCYQSWLNSLLAVDVRLSEEEARDYWDNEQSSRINIEKVRQQPTDNKEGES